MPNDDDICATCANSWAWHVENKPVHPFNDGQAGAKAFLDSRRARDPKSRDSDAQRGSETPPTVVWPTDPVLRIALMNAGVITADDLRRAEQQLRAAMGEVLAQGGQGGEGQVQVGEAASVDVG